jgi:hypothetical protein
MMHSPPKTGSSLVATASTPSSFEACVSQAFMPMASNNCRMNLSNSVGCISMRSGRLSSPTMASIPSTNLYRASMASKSTIGFTASRS